MTDAWRSGEVQSCLEMWCLVRAWYFAWGVLAGNNFSNSQLSYGALALLSEEILAHGINLIVMPPAGKDTDFIEEGVHPRRIGRDMDAT